MRVICTAGHVDHGKSALVRALTGMEPDRFAEEQARGLTIDLGFAWTELGERTVAFVDVPGHERFITNMLAGAGAVDLCLFVVAADEGWMPQSSEHLEILDLLGVRRGLVALTKADTVDADTAEIGAEIVREQLAGSTLADAPIVACSATTGAGLESLTAALTDLLDHAPPPPDEHRPRVWVDRVFTVRGAGTVATGTLTGGGIEAGDELAVLPGDRRVRARGLQALGAAVTAAAPGSRLAVNLAGVDRDEVARGHAIGRPGQWLGVDRIDAWVHTVGGHELGRTGDWHLHVGSAERLVRCFPLDGDVLAGTEGAVRLELVEPVAVCAGDRFVLRESGRQATVAGGVVLDADPPARPRGPSARLARAEQLEHRAKLVADLAAADPARGEGADPSETRLRLLAAHVAERGAVARRRAAAACGVADAGVARAVEAGAVLALGAQLADPRAVTAWGDAVSDALAAYHRERPVDRVAPKNIAVRAARTAGVPAAAVDALLDHLVAAGRLTAEGPGLRTPDHVVELDEDLVAARDALLDALNAEPFSPPALSVAAQSVGAPEALVRELEAAGQLVRLEGDLAVTDTALDAAAERLRAVYAAEGPLTASRAKDALETSRKYAMPLLAELDRRGVTRRVGDLREVR